MLEIVVAVLLGLDTLVISYLGIHLAIHPAESPHAKLVYKAAFVCCGIAGLVLIGVQAKMSTDAQTTSGERIAAIGRGIEDMKKLTASRESDAPEAVLARDELAEAAGLQPTTVEISAAQIWGQDIKFGPMLELIPAAKHHRALASFKTANPDRWQEILRGSLNFVSAKLA
jgi:hypothetical protein